MVAGNVQPASIPVHLRVVFLYTRSVLPKTGRGRASGRLKRMATFLSLLHVQVQESPPYLPTFHFSPLLFNFISGPDFLYISFDLVRLGPPIGIDSMSIFHFGSPSFNFRIGCKKLNIFGTEVSICGTLSFD